MYGIELIERSGTGDYIMYDTAGRQIKISIATGDSSLVGTLTPDIAQEVIFRLEVVLKELNDSTPPWEEPVKAGGTV